MADSASVVEPEPREFLRRADPVLARVIDAHDPYCRGIVLLGLEAPEEDLASAFRIARRCSRVKGFAVGRTIFAEPAQSWFSGAIDDEQAAQLMADGFARLCAAWRDAAEEAPAAPAGKVA